MTLHPRASGSTVILERIEGDASGNNDRQRIEVARMTIPEAEAMAGALERALEEAVNAAAAARREHLAKTQNELAAARRKVADLMAEVDRLRKVDKTPGVDPTRSEAEAPAAEVAGPVSTAALTAVAPKTHPLSAKAICRLLDIAKTVTPTQEVNADIVDRLLREDLVRVVQRPSPYKTHSGKLLSHLEITAAGRAVLDALP